LGVGWRGQAGEVGGVDVRAFGSKGLHLVQILNLSSDIGRQELTNTFSLQQPWFTTDQIQMFTSEASLLP
jgi:hypothetical protein